MRTMLSITGLQIYAYHGLIEEEQRLGQKFWLNIHSCAVSVSIEVFPPVHDGFCCQGSEGLSMLEKPQKLSLSWSVLPSKT